ncbi:MAG TPA: NAD-dependent epimerase/dehydratase family protein [Chloroflexota bacterium]|nr:NAD-dependent epimerase/dehydratase family protein [Chloroflexota bacterium]
MDTILITGATGYIGRHLVARLAARGAHPRCLLRSSSGRGALPEGAEPVAGDLGDPASLDAAMKRVTAIVHLAAVVANLKQSKTVSYRGVNDEGTANLVRAARRSGVAHFVHLGGLNTIPGSANSYIRTRYNGEQHVRTGGIPYSILQPSILFGDGSQFFTTLADLARRSPILPVPGNGRLRFQPIWVEDVVTCLLALLDEGGRDETVGVGGPAYYTYDQLLDLIGARIGKRRPKVHLPLPLVTPAAAVMERLLPRPPVTVAALELFASGDNVTSLDSVSARFGFQPRSLEEQLRGQGY